MKIIKDFIDEICNLLNINPPSISFDASRFTSPTMMAQVDPEESVIFIKKPKQKNPDFFFAIAHELRHIWQYQKDKNFYLANYKSSDKCKSVEEYNLQIAEVDANAFAAIIMNEWFHLHPKWKGLSDKVISAIEERILIIIKANR